MHELMPQRATMIKHTAAISGLLGTVQAQMIGVVGEVIFLILHLFERRKLGKDPNDHLPEAVAYVMIWDEIRVLVEAVKLLHDSSKHPLHRSFIMMGASPKHEFLTSLEQVFGKSKEILEIARLSRNLGICYCEKVDTSER